MHLQSDLGECVYVWWSRSPYLLHSVAVSIAVISAWPACVRKESESERERKRKNEGLTLGSQYCNLFILYNILWCNNKPECSF